MKTHVWIKGRGEMQYAPIATLVLTLRSPLDQSYDSTYLANGIEVSKYRWNVLKEEIGTHATALDNMAREY